MVDVVNHPHEVVPGPQVSDEAVGMDIYQEEVPRGRFLSLIPHLEALHHVFYKIPQKPNRERNWDDHIMGVEKYRPSACRPWRWFPRLQVEIWDQIDSKPGFVELSLFPGFDIIKSTDKVLSSDLPWREKLEECHNVAINKSLSQAIKILHDDEELRKEFFVSGNLTFGKWIKGIVSIDNRSFTEPCYVVLHIPKHLLTLQELTAGLTQMNTKNVVNKCARTWGENAAAFVLTALTQLFTRMVHSGVWFGYIHTGVAYVFCRIPRNEPTSIEFYLCVPAKDVRIDQTEPRSKWARRTALGQVLPFVLQSLSVGRPTQEWHDLMDKENSFPTVWFDYWTTVPRVDDYYRYNPPPKWDYYNSPWIKVWKDQLKSDLPIKRTVTSDLHAQISKPSQVPYPYCTMKCLLSTKNNAGLLDRECPNVFKHGGRSRTTHVLNSSEIVRGLYLQLNRNRFKGFQQLNIRGRVAFMIKARLKSHGYTVLIKATEEKTRDQLRTEFHTYTALRDLQGTVIPVCLWEFQPRCPYWYHGSQMVSMMILSWSGIRINKHEATPQLVRLMNREGSRASSIVAQHGFFEMDPAWRNVLWNKETRSCFAIDLEDVFHGEGRGRASPEMPEGPGMVAIRSNKRKARSFSPPSSEKGARLEILEHCHEDH